MDHERLTFDAAQVPEIPAARSIRGHPGATFSRGAVPFDPPMDKSNQQCTQDADYPRDHALASDVPVGWNGKEEEGGGKPK
jgi:hypothetical protein